MKNKQKIVINVSNNNNLNKKTISNIKLLFRKKFKGRNNYLIPLNSHFQKRSLISNLKDNKIKFGKITNSTNNTHQKQKKLKNDNIQTAEISLEQSKSEKDNFKNKSNDDIPNRFFNKNSYFLHKKRNINNPINNNKFFLFNDDLDQEIILNNRSYKINQMNKSIETNIFLSNSDKSSRNNSINISSISSNILKKRISIIVKDISNNHKNKNNIYNNESKSTLMTHSKLKLKTYRNKSIDFFAKKNKNKFLNLLNREGALINFLKSMKINTTYNFFKARKKPKCKIEMNNLLINSFGQNRSSRNEYSKQLYTLNENFFTALKKMKKERVAIGSRNYDEKRNSNCSSLSLEIMKEDEKIWERKFINNIYKNKLSETEFIDFKNINKFKQQKLIIKHSKIFADKMLNLNLDEYEYPNKYDYFKSTGNCISINNINRIRKMNKLMKDLEGREQFNVLDLNLEQLKNIQKKSEAEGIIAINRAGKPRCVKTKFRQSTIIKFNSVSGEFFGVPT